jgi:hypothetical protein
MNSSANFTAGQNFLQALRNVIDLTAVHAQAKLNTASLMLYWDMNC